MLVVRSQMKTFTTVPEVLEQVSRHKQITRETLYTYFRKLGIKPIGEIRQSPQRYPADTANKILTGLGLR